MHTTAVDHPVMSTDTRRTLFDAAASLLHLIVSFVRRRACALRGHDLMMEFAPKRLSLRCAACGHNTPGWVLDVKMPPVPRLPRIRVVARTASAGVKTLVNTEVTPVIDVMTQPLSVPSHAADHAQAA